MSPSLQPLKGQTAIITGASAGIGQSISLALGKAGVACVLAARRENKLKAVAEEIVQAGGKALVVPTDVSQEAQLQLLVQRAIEEFGCLNILINNAGIYHRAEVEQLEEAKLRESLAINLVAPMLLSKYALPYLKEKPGAAIINISSIAGTMGFARGSAYSASKFGMMGFSESLFEEVRESGIKVCAICPGFVATPMANNPATDQQKMIATEDIAHAVIDILTMSVRSCPTKIIIRPQYSPYIS